MRACVKVHCKPKTESLYRTAIDRYLVPALGAMAVKDVRSSHVIELLDRRPVCASRARLGDGGGTYPWVRFMNASKRGTVNAA